MKISNKDVVHLLRSVAAAYILTGVSPFRINAYHKTADAVEQLTQELYDIWQNDKLESFDGAGATLKQHLNDYFVNQEENYLVKQTERIPATVYELMKAPGIGPKKAYKVIQKYELNNTKTIFDDIKKLAKKGKIAVLDGFGEKSEKDMVKAIEIFEERGKSEERMTLPKAFSIAEDIIAYLKKNKHVKNIDTLGSLRRMAPTIGDVDLAITCAPEHTEEIVAYFVKYPHKQTIESQGSSKAAITVTGGKWVDLRIVSDEIYGSMLQHNTGSKSHNIQLREFSLKKGLSLSEFGIKDKKTDEVHTISDEKEFYKFLGLQFVPPELREGTDEVKLAKQKKLPKLVEEKDIRGEFHVHSNFNVIPSHDLGKDSIETMAKKAMGRSYTYLALSEHNPAMSRLSEKEIVEIIKKKKEAIQKVEDTLKNIKLFNSLEIDIMPDGKLALPKKAFDYLDLVVVSIHSSFRMARADMTERILNGLDNPKVKILGHPTGRLLSKREEIDVDWKRVFDFAKKKNIAIEINSSPERLDLPDMLVRQAIKNGNKLVVDTDSHAASQMDSIFYGISVARRGWATKNDIINTKSINEITTWLHT